MPRPKSGYKNKDGQPVPGTTTIVGRFKESGALMYWAWKCGKEGIDINKTKEDAADAGTCCHAMIEADLNNRKFEMAKWDALVIAKAEHAFLAYLEWAERSKLSPVQTEVSLVSEQHQFGGTLDTVYSCNSLTLLDYKTSSGIYPDMLVQVAGGYSLLWEEHFPQKPLQGIDLLRISKPKQPDDPIMFEHRHWSAEIFPIAQEQFLCFRRAYELDKRLKGFM